MIIIEITGVISSGKSQIIKNLLKKNRIILIQDLVKFSFLLRKIRSERMINMILEIYFILIFNLSLIRKVKQIYKYHMPKSGSIKNFKLFRSLVRKFGYLLILESKRNKKEYVDYIVLIDEGFYQIIQNLITIEFEQVGISSLLDYQYQPDLLVICTSDTETLVKRSLARKDLTKRFKGLDSGTLMNIIDSSISNYGRLASEYKKRFNCDSYELSGFTQEHLSLRGVALVNNTNE